MSGQPLRLVALIVLGLSVALAFMARRMSLSATQPAPSVKALEYASVVAIKPLGPDALISPDQVGIDKSATPVPNGFSRPDEVIGKRPRRLITAGDPVLASDLIEDSLLSQELRGNERAVAIRVDDAIGLGGFARPGDLVDVLFFAKRDGREVNSTQARVLLESARILTFGKSAKSEGSLPTPDARTAVLAVPRDQAPALLLAESVGKLRLSLRQPSLGPADSQERASAAVDLEDLLRSPDRAPAHTTGVTIYRGLAR